MSQDVPGIGAGSRQEILRSLRTHYLFAGLDEEILDRLCPHLRVRHFSAGQSLFDQGDTATEFFVLLEGAIKLYRVSMAGQEKIMRLIQPGQTFAETVMFMNEPHYLVHAQGLEDGTLVSIDSNAYLDVMRQSFATCRAVMARMSERIQQHWNEIELLTLQNSRYRVVQYMLELLSQTPSDHNEIALPMRKALIASHLGITPETLSRILRELEQKELIHMQGYKIQVPSLSRLRQDLD